MAERIYAHLHAVYEMLFVHFRKTSREERLLLIFKALQDTIHSNTVLFSAILVVEVYPGIQKVRN